MKQATKVAIIGGGIVGCAVLYALAKRGWTDAVLLERLELTSGSTWHAAGNITHFGHYAEITQLYVESLNIYRQAEQETGQSIGFHQTGSLRLATSRAELEAYKTLEPLYEQLGVPYRVVDADEVGRLNPLVNTEGLFGAAHTPADGHVDASGATHALAKAARAMGAEICRQSPIKHIRQVSDHRWELETDAGTLRAEHVVLAASFWTRDLALQLGLDLPLYAFEHHVIITDDVAALKAMDREVPTIRDPASPANIRQERYSLLCGVYETNPVLWGTDGIPKVGRMNLIYVSDKRGRILTELSCVRLAENSFVLITAATAQWHDGDLIRNSVPEGVAVRETTTERETLIIAGPTSRDLLAGITDADLTKGWLTHQHATVAGKKAFLIRVSFAGELGWEVHAENADMPAIYDAVLAAGAKPFGMWALNSLRLEKGYRAWKGDLSTDYSLLEGGLDRFVKFDKPYEFAGKAALLAEKQRGVFEIDSEDVDAFGGEPVFFNGEIVGEVTSGSYGHCVGKSLALAYVRGDARTAKDGFEISVVGEKHNAKRLANPPYDPTGNLLRS